MGRCPYFEECGDVPLQSIKYCHDLLAIRNAQLLQGNEPLHKALVTALESLCTRRAIVGGVLACEVPGGGMRYVGSGLSK